MTTEKFVKKTIVRIVVMILISVFAFSFMNASNAIISNYVALGQMENSDGMFIFMEIYNNAIRPIMVGILTAVIGYGVGMIIYDTYKFIKKRNGEKENEKD